jgi:cytochrome b561
MRQPAGDVAKAVHEVGQWLVHGLIGLHLAGVSYHLIVRRAGPSGVGIYRKNYRQ